MTGFRRVLGVGLVVLMGWSFVADIARGDPLTLGQVANIAVALTLVAGLFGWLPLGAVPAPRPPELRFGYLRSGREPQGPTLVLDVTAVNRGEDTWWIEEVSVLSPENLVVGRGEGVFRLEGDAATELEIPIALGELSWTSTDAAGGGTQFETRRLTMQDMMYGSRGLSLKLVHHSGRVYAVSIRATTEDPALDAKMVAAYLRTKGAVAFYAETMDMAKEKAPWVPPKVVPSSIVDVGNRPPTEILNGWREFGEPRGSREVTKGQP